MDFEEPLTKYLPWFSVHTDYAPLTAHDLLTHTAGIPGNRDDIFNSPYMAAALAEQHAAWPAGERFYYSNVGYQVLHELLLTVTGKPYEEIIRERFFEPLGMTRSNPTIRLESRERQAVAYVTPYDDRPAHAARPLVEAQLLEYAIGDGCIQATAGDLAAYVRLWLNRGAAGERRVVSPESFDAFATIYPGTTEPGEPDDGYGYGVNVHERDGAAPMLAHSGGMVGHYAYASADLRDGHGVSVLVNGPGAPTEIGELALEIWRAIDAGEALPEADDDTPEPFEAGDYAGRFRAGDGSELNFDANGEELALVRGNERIVLEARGTDVFYTPAAGLDRYYFHFGRDEDDKVVEVSHGAGWYVNSAYDGETRFDVPAEWVGLHWRVPKLQPVVPLFRSAGAEGRSVDLHRPGRRNRQRRDAPRADRFRAFPDRRGAGPGGPGVQGHRGRPGAQRHALGPRLLPAIAADFLSTAYPRPHAPAQLYERRKHYRGARGAAREPAVARRGNLP